jgi:hypothetical protein
MDSYYDNSIISDVFKNPLSSCFSLNLKRATGRASYTTFERPWENFSTQFEPVYATNTSHCKREKFIYEYPLYWVILCTEKRTTECCSSVVYSSSMVNLSSETRSEHAHACQLPRLSWSWIVLLPSDKYRKLITSITAVYFHLWPIYRLSFV